MELPAESRRSEWVTKQVFTRRLRSGGKAVEAGLLEEASVSGEQGQGHRRREAAENATRIRRGRSHSLGADEKLKAKDIICDSNKRCLFSRHIPQSLVPIFYSQKSFLRKSRGTHKMATSVLLQA